MGRFVTLLLSLALLAATVPADQAGQSGVLIIGTVAAAFAVAAIAISLGRTATSQAHCIAGSALIADERRLHGSFRRASSPDTPGRPRPRAPGAGFRPAR